MPENWNLFERLNEDGQTMTFMNTALKDTAPLAGYTKLITIIFNMYSLWDKAGGGSRTAQELFYSLEDKLIEGMQASEYSVYIGRTSIQNKMELYFYGQGSIHWEDRLKAILADFPDFRYYYTVRADEEWSFYMEEMYPTPIEEQWMRNAKIAFALQRHGDDPDTVRIVEHWLHFSSKHGMDEAKGRARKLGYHVVNAELDTSKTINPYVLQLSKKHALDLSTVNKITKELYALASEAGGTYDGWGTSLKLKLPARIRASLMKLWKRKMLFISSLAASAIVAFVLWIAL